MDRLPLTIDLAMAAASVNDRGAREWGREQRIFVSSLIDGYGDYRQAAIDAIIELDAEPIVFERFGGRDSDPHEAYLTEVRASTVYVGLLGDRYGRPLTDRFSATHKEFREAEEVGVRTTVWVQEGVDREGPQQSFVDEVRVFQVTGAYRSPDDLRLALGRRLRAIASEDLSPWVKLGNLIFRASEVRETGDAVMVRASVRDPAVAGDLRALADRTRRSRQVFAYADRVLVAEPRSVATTTRASRTLEVELELVVAEPQQPTKMNFNGASWDQLTQLAVRVSLFGEQNPLGFMQHMAQIRNPFPELRAAGVPEEALRPLAQLMLSEVLVTERGVQRVQGLALGQAVAGGRRLRIRWQDPPLYRGQASPPLVELEGKVDW
jgi:hypothetical protein